MQNPGFARFVAEELVPAVDAEYRTRADRDARVILGTSLGGLFSAYLGLQHPDVFGKLAIQSPAFWVSERPEGWTGPSIYARMASASPLWDIHMTTGTVNDTESGARRMRDVMTERGLAVDYREVPEGHSWGNWRALVDDALISLLPARATSADDPPRAGGGILHAFPNPARAFVMLEIRGQNTPVRIACADSLGREVMATSTSREAHAVRLPTGSLAPGVYVCTATAPDGRTASPPQTVTIAR